MGPNEIFEALWAMPWYQVLWVALWDDVILFCKVWWVFVLVPGIGVGFALLQEWREGRKNG